MQLSRRSLIAGALVLLVVVIGFWMWSTHVSAPTTPETDTTQEATATEETTREAPVPHTELVRTADVPAASKSAEVQGTATLAVDDTRYALTAPAGATLKDAMDKLATESSFTYRFRDYAGLGAFVTEINNRASTGDLVWILYVNGKKSAVGISSTHIRSNDLIEWKLEMSY